jgi:hypothetical protein
VAVGAVAVGAGAGVCWWSASPLKPTTAQAAPPAPPPPSAYAPQAAPPPVSSDYANRVVAYYGERPVTREMLGEYLIARYGADKLELFVNRLIIEDACKAHGVEVSAAEVEAALADDLKGLGLNRKEFVDNYLKSHHLNLVEWKEDIIRPKLMLAKLVRSRVQYTEQDVADAYDAHYGERIRAKLIIWPQEEEKSAFAEYARIRDDPAEFERRAKNQLSRELSATGGLVKEPIGRRTTGDEPFEKDLFSLQPGELTQVHGTPGGIVVAKCVERVKADTSVSLDKERPRLIAEILKKKTEIEIPRYFAELQKQASPRLLMKSQNKPEDIAGEVQKLLSDSGGTPPRPTPATP